jgi:hypothetical protein
VYNIGSLLDTQTAGNLFKVELDLAAVQD